MVRAWRLRVRTGKGQVELAIPTQDQYLRLKARIAQARRVGKTVLGIIGRVKKRATRKQITENAARTRWYGNFAMARRGRPLAASACVSSRVFVVIVTNHNGFGLCVSKDGSLVHSATQESANTHALEISCWL